ncbi:hypothetical protein DCAR_0521961 [Daucus carota subsp. sativus]|uniref:IST1-like protein n=1 Tax=Daucus carota subsp. sativus TaxID=79200 RepID=A0AAF1B3F7_DAUCS|nr:hypothetical protein DCAR_0521961 [Daucus carota subsp. sativus]
MLDVIFGWGKASKCKKLLRRVQCRLKLLKNKRSSILRYSRDDVALLLKFGYDQNAFNRVEHIIKDERMFAVYDLLEAFCEFIVINLPYIRKHRDCPNDINEAVSTLVFASARCGDLPELCKLRSLFAKRYGQKMTKIALELLPGNLVNQTIKENLSAKSVSDDARYKLMDEIASSIKEEPLALEYTPDQSSDSETIPESGTYGKHSEYGDSDLQAMIVSKAEGNEEGNRSPLALDYSKQPFLTERREEGGIYEDSTSEMLSDQKPEKIVYLDDIEEFKFPVRKDGNNIQDQRLFLFKSSDSTRKESEVWYDGDIDLHSSMNKKASSKSYIKSRKGDGNKLRKRTQSAENINVNDLESSIYYGGSMNSNLKSYECRDLPKKVQVKDGSDDSESPPLLPKRRIVAVEDSHGVKNKPGSCNGVTTTQPESVHKEKMYVDYLPYEHMSQAKQEAECISTLIRPKQTQHSYTRATTMPPKRPEDDQADSILRSKSFPFQQPTDLWSNAPRSPCIHPKLPDYNELAEQFMALKKAALQKQPQRRK